MNAEDLKALEELGLKVEVSQDCIRVEGAGGFKETLDPNVPVYDLVVPEREFIQAVETFCSDYDGLREWLAGRIVVPDQNSGTNKQDNELEQDEFLKELAD